MKNGSQLADKIAAGDFIVTAELLPEASASASEIEAAAGFFKKGIVAVNVADNPHGPILSSLAGALLLEKAGIEPVYQMVTRDRNRIALQSDLLGAVALGVKNVLCLSGHHQALTTSRESANVYDIDSIQLMSAAKQMSEEGLLLNGNHINGPFTLLIGAAAHPDMKPLALNMLRLAKKVDAGARFIQTQAVFDVDLFSAWMKAAGEEGIPGKAAILAGILPLTSADEARALREKYMDTVIPDDIIERLKAAGDAAAQKKEGLAICVETLKKIRTINGVSGIHLLSGGREDLVPEILAASGL